MNTRIFYIHYPFVHQHHTYGGVMAVTINSNTTLLMHILLVFTLKYSVKMESLLLFLFPYDTLLS